eukprot:m.70504 g.70504  ORF g.70504 m.70504 type:complete len:107 (-) comp14070_c0_seq4:1116-1436(-)
MGNIFSANALRNASASAIDIGAGVSSFVIASNRCGGEVLSVPNARPNTHSAPFAAAASRQAYGIHVHPGASSDFVIQGNLCQGNMLGGIRDESSSTSGIVVNNVGV